MSTTTLGYPSAPDYPGKLVRHIQMVDHRELLAIAHRCSVRCTRQLSWARLCTQWLGIARICTEVTQLDVHMHHGGFWVRWAGLWAVSVCIVQIQSGGRLGVKRCVPAVCSLSPDSRAEGPALGTLGSTVLRRISARCCIACRDVALVIQQSLPNWKRGLQGELAALYQGASKAVQGKLSRNVSCLLSCSSPEGHAVVETAPLPGWPVPMCARSAWYKSTRVCSSFP